MIRCKLEMAYTREEVDGDFQLDVLPREGEFIRAENGRKFKVSDVTHVLTTQNLSTYEVILGVWNV